MPRNVCWGRPSGLERGRSVCAELPPAEGGWEWSCAPWDGSVMRRWGLAPALSARGHGLVCYIPFSISVVASEGSKNS